VLSERGFVLPCHPGEQVQVKPPRMASQLPWTQGLLWQ